MEPIQKIVQEAGLPDGRKSGFHRNRKTVASVAYAAGLDPQDCLTTLIAELPSDILIQDSRGASRRQM